MKITTALLLLISASCFAQKDVNYETTFEKGNGNQTASYQQTIEYYKLLAKDFKTISIQEMVLTDSGEPLHIVTFSADENFDFASIRKNKAILLFNNGIHPGEPDGIDATMQLYRDLALGKISVPKNTVLVTIPVYNIGGALNRNSTTRVNQDGPEVYGFRGNARNYDLNRDFIKSDSRNTSSFAAIFQLLKPDVFIDNHVSNGADYQYKLTYIMTQQNKIGKILGDFMDKEMNEAVVQDLKKKELPMTPYVNAFSDTPDTGFTQFYDSPRYSTGYASLFNTIGYVVETHMLKNYQERVHATYEFMRSILDYTDSNFNKIKEKRIANESLYKPGSKYALKYKIDSTSVANFEFLGYEGSYKKSDVTSGERLFYDRQKPFKKNIPYLKNYVAVDEITIPKAYIIPKGFWNIIALLKSNGIVVQQLEKDRLIPVESYKIEDYNTTSSPYEGHYLHRNTKVGTTVETIAFKKGDYIVSTEQTGVKYLLETLEPAAIDSFFNWNFFDTMLQQKEGYSAYVFEDTAAKIIRDNPETKKAFEQKKKSDKVFAKDAAAQLDWIYKNSAHYEKAHLQYPIYRMM
ncbi:MAG: M14 family metallopeptidase [Flavobacterium sp.]|nr:M14 family metallopeptidase [Flavobacterium sp.]